MRFDGHCPWVVLKYNNQLSKCFDYKDFSFSIYIKTQDLYLMNTFKEEG